MKVVHLSTSDRGGAGLAAVRLHKALLIQGVDSKLLTLYKFQDGIPGHVQFFPGEGKLFPVIENTIYKFRKALKYSGALPFRHERMAHHHLMGRPDGFENFSFAVSSFDVGYHPLVQEADIVHLHWVSEGFIDYKSFFHTSQKKIIWTLHDMNPFTGGCHHSDDCRKFTLDCSPCPQLYNTVDDHYAGEILREKKHALDSIGETSLSIVTPSKWLGQLSASSELFRKFRHVVIPNASDDASFVATNREDARKKLNLPLDKKIILMTAHHVDNPRKGVQYLLEALRMIERKDILLCSAGDFLDIKSFPEMHNFGYVSDTEKMALIYSAADLFALPSLAENFPNTICESLLCGTPVIAFSQGGIPELVNESNGRLALLKDTAGLKRCIEYIFEHETEFNRGEIRNNIIQKTGSSLVASQYSGFYTEIINQSAR